MMVDIEPMMLQVTTMPKIMKLRILNSFFLKRNGSIKKDNTIGMDITDETIVPIPAGR